MTAAPAPPSPSHPRWKIAAASAVIMTVLALIGVGIATAAPRAARNYWLGLIPVYGVLCTVTAWKRSGASEALVLRQVLHWLVIAAAVALDFALRGSGFETQLSSGLNALLLLTVGCLLAGVHLDWLFVPVGVLLGLTFAVVAKADQYLWLLLVAGLAVLGLLAGGRRLLAGRKPETGPVSGPS